MIASSELIINPDGSIYHLHLRPEQIADTIITVGDPDRVALITQYFDEIECEVQKREFVTTTGRIGDKRLTVISTGIGTDNIDIVLNELDALANIDFETRAPKIKHRELQIIRVGTSGALQKDSPLDSFLVSEYAVGLDGLMLFYQEIADSDCRSLSAQLQAHAPNELPLRVYASKASASLLELFSDIGPKGITLTAPGFYAPQGRNLRGHARREQFLERFLQFTWRDRRLTNLEMETAAIYGLAQLLGHQAISLNALLANRSTGAFSKDPKATVVQLIEQVLEKLSSD